MIRVFEARDERKRGPEDSLGRGRTAAATMMLEEQHFT
jgi:hypothetical protein